ncbi:DUF2860 family protein [Vibrio sp. S9_S30]|uniref:DUF2860 family protein n=1 Tax=Vibrio sp. S9_S30 TaxID=2720226 RepID=UPI00168029EB|nr:DUF2860 family protein [Vibrio sp. S9_S30]MBD1559316.1 DUF2860 family protein [Vibrio sp. S9_S30]
MKYLHRTVGLTCLVISPSLIANTEATEQETPFEPGWQFALSANVGVGTEQSQLNTHDDNKTTDSLQSSGKSTSGFGVFPFVRVEYTLDNGHTQFYLGQSEDQVTDEQFQAEIGVNHYQDGLGLINAAYFPNIPGVNEVWEDAYVIGSARKTTNSNAQGGRIAFSPDTILPVTFRYAFVQYEVENDKSGKGQNLSAENMKKLERDSQYQRMGVETVVPLTDNMALLPALNYTIRNADGNAHSFKEFGGNLGLQASFGKHSFVAHAGIAQRGFDTKNPIFNQKQDTTITNLFALYSYAQPFGWKNASVSVIGGMGNEDSDINFHDVESKYISAGVNYLF